jgi:transcriptional regulator with GAF, ATPase, and Fis domain
MNQDDTLADGAQLEASVDPSKPLGNESALQSSQRLRALYDIGRLVLAARAPLEILKSIQAAVVEHLEPEHACVLAVAPDGSARAVTSHNLDLTPRPEEWDLSQTVLRRVAQTALGLLVTDARLDAQIGGADSVHRLNIRSVLCVPLGRDPVRGVIYLDSRRSRRRFSRDDLEFLTAVSFHATQILDRASEQLRASEAIEQSGERLALLEAELTRHQIVGRSAKLLGAYDRLRRLARGGARVLLRGETGTGKDLFARAYAAASPRAGRAFIPVPIPALAPSLLESELFGHLKGAFTEAARDKKGRLELADSGVLFLDEVGDVEPALQPKLLRFLDSGELYRVGDTSARCVDALVVSATNRPLEKLIEERRFRDDLFARLGHSLRIPALRERPEDVPLLVEHFLAMHERGERRKSFSAAALDLMQSYRWEFNVRQLQQVVEHAVCLVDDDVVGPDDLPDFLRARVPAASPVAPLSSPDAPPGVPGPLEEVVDAAERAHLLRTLEHTGGNKRRAIELLKIAPETFYRRLEEFGLHKKKA